MERLIDRAFSQAHALKSKEAVQPQEQRAPEKQVEEEAPDAIKRILKCWENKEYFKLIQLPEPTADELGRPVWPCTSQDVSRAYRKLSVLVHPDKNPGEDARKAFEALNEAHRILKDPGKLEEVLKDAAVRARAEREKAEARATGEERIQLNAAKIAKARELRKEEGKSFKDEIVEQMKRRTEEAKRKQEAVRRAKATQLQQQQQSQQQEADDSDEEERRQVVKKRKKPVFI